MKSVSIKINKDDGIHLQAHRGGTSLNGIGSELIIFLIVQISFCYSWFRLQSIAIHCNRRGSDDRYTSHETLSQTHWPCARITLRLKVSQRVSDNITHAHVITCLSVRCLFLFCLLVLPLAPLLSLSLSTCSLSCSSTSMSSKPPRNKTTAPTHNEECCTVAIHNPLEGYEPNLLDNFDYSETSPAILQDESGDIDTEPSYSCDAELDDEIKGKALSSPLLIQEREVPANLRLAYHSHEESLLPAQSFFAHTSTVRPVHEPSSSQKRKSGRDMEHERIRILLERQKEQILAKVRTETQKHEFQAESERSGQELTGIIDSQRREIDHTITGCEQSRRHQLLLQEQLSEQNRDLLEAHIKSLHEMDELKSVQGLRIDEFSRTRLIENQDTINELLCRKIRFKTQVCTCSQFPTELCHRSKKWRWLNQWMI